jgi:hypothetical protein
MERINNQYSRHGLDHIGGIVALPKLIGRDIPRYDKVGVIQERGGHRERKGLVHDGGIDESCSGKHLVVGDQVAAGLLSPFIVEEYFQCRGDSNRSYKNQFDKAQCLRPRGCVDCNDQWNGRVYGKRGGRKLDNAAAIDGRGHGRWSLRSVRGGLGRDLGGGGYCQLWGLGWRCPYCWWYIPWRQWCRRYRYRWDIEGRG